MSYGTDTDFSQAMEARVRALCASSRSVGDCLEELADVFNEHAPHSFWKEVLRNYNEEDYESDRKWFKNHLRGVFSKDPPGDDVRAFFFGLETRCFEASDGSYLWTPGLDVVGCEEFDEEDEDCEWACDSVYEPDGLVMLDVLSDLTSRFEDLSGTPGRVDHETNEVIPVQSFDEYAGEKRRSVSSQDSEAAMLGQLEFCWAYAALVVARGCRTLDKELFLNGQEERAIACGWQSGTGVLLGRVTREGQLVLPATDA